MLQMTTKLKKNRFTIERRIFQNSKYLHGFSKNQQNKWTEWRPYHDVDKISVLNTAVIRCDKLRNLNGLIQEFRFINNYPAVSTQLQFNLLNREEDDSTE